jgi:hypothetical protein
MSIRVRSVVYLTMLPVAQTVHCRMVGWVMNNELDTIEFAWNNWGKPRDVSVRIAGLRTGITTLTGEWVDVEVTLQTRIRQVLGSTLDLTGFLCSSQASPDKCQGCILLLGYNHFLPDPYQFMNRLTMRRYIGWFQFRRSYFYNHRGENINLKCINMWLKKTSLLVRIRGRILGVEYAMKGTRSFVIIYEVPSDVNETSILNSWQRQHVHVLWMKCHC